MTFCLLSLANAAGKPTIISLIFTLLLFQKTCHRTFQTNFILLLNLVHLNVTLLYRIDPNVTQPYLLFDGRVRNTVLTHFILVWTVSDSPQVFFLFLFIHLFIFYRQKCPRDLFSSKITNSYHITDIYSPSVHNL